MTKLLLALSLALGFAFGTSGGDADVTALGREHTALFYEGRLEELWTRFTPQMQEAMGDTERLGAFREQLEAQLGSEQELLREETKNQFGGRSYLRTARFEKFEGEILVRWIFDAQGRVAGFQITPAEGSVPKEAPTQFLDYRTKTELRLPFAQGDEWYVFWGGRTVEQNYHAAYPDQRFAYDFLALVDGKTHSGDGSSLEDYYCFGREIVAPDAGRVVSVEADLPDNAPGVMDPANALGNHVVLDHGNGEFSFLAHFQAGSVAVELGDEVAAGDLLGRTGNSGNTSEPHLHYHLQDAPEFQKGGRGLPAQFQGYLADDRPVERGEPVQGQVVAVPR